MDLSLLDKVKEGISPIEEINIYIELGNKALEETDNFLMAMEFCSKITIKLEEIDNENIRISSNKNKKKDTPSGQEITLDDELLYRINDLYLRTYKRYNAYIDELYLSLEKTQDQLDVQTLQLLNNIASLNSQDKMTDELTKNVEALNKRIKEKEK